MKYPALQATIDVVVDGEFQKNFLSNIIAHELGNSYSYKKGIYDFSVIGKDQYNKEIYGDEYIGSYVENRYRNASKQGLRSHYGIIYDDYDQPTQVDIPLFERITNGGQTVRRAIKSNKNGTITYFNFNF